MKSRDEIVRDCWEYFLGSGAPYVGAPTDPTLVDRYPVPAPLRRLWQTLGLGFSHEGLVQFFDPADFAFVLDHVFGEDADFWPTESLVFAFTAFGRLRVWNRRWGSVSIDLTSARVSPFFAKEPPNDFDAELNIASQLASLGPSTCDHRDSRDKPLFERAAKKLGALEFGEVYGFFPARLLGGCDLKHLRRVKAAEHFSILAQLTPFTLVNASKLPVREIRLLG